MSEEETNVQEQEKARPLCVSFVAFISPGVWWSLWAPMSLLHLRTAYPIGTQMVLALTHHCIVCDECIGVYSNALSLCLFCCELMLMLTLTLTLWSHSSLFPLNRSKNWSLVYCNNLPRSHRWFAAEVGLQVFPMTASSACKDHFTINHAVQLQIHAQWSHGIFCKFTPNHLTISSSSFFILPLSFRDTPPSPLLKI